MGFEPTTPTLARLCCVDCGGRGYSPRHVLISLPARLLAEELQKVGMSRGKGPVRSEGRPSIRSINNQAARGTGEAKSPRVRLNKCASPKLRFTASRGSASAPPSTSHRPRPPSHRRGCRKAAS